MKITNMFQYLWLRWVDNRKIVAWIFTSIALVFAILSSIIQSYDKLIEETDFILELDLWFNVSTGYMPREYASILIAIAVFICLIVALYARHEEKELRYFWLVVTAGLTFIFLAKSTRVFHRLYHILRRGVINTDLVVIVTFGVAFVVALAVGLVVFKFVKETYPLLPEETRMRLIRSAVIYVLGALVLEKIGEAVWFVTWSPNLIYEYLGSVEEFTEMAGFIYLQFSLLSYYDHSRKLKE